VRKVVAHIIANDCELQLEISHDNTRTKVAEHMENLLTPNTHGDCIVLHALVTKFPLKLFVHDESYKSITCFEGVHPEHKPVEGHACFHNRHHDTLSASKAPDFSHDGSCHWVNCKVTSEEEECVNFLDDILVFSSDKLLVAKLINSLDPKQDGGYLEEPMPDADQESDADESHLEEPMPDADQELDACEEWLEDLEWEAEGETICEDQETFADQDSSKEEPGDSSSPSTCSPLPNDEEIESARPPLPNDEELEKECERHCPKHRALAGKHFT